MYIDSLFIKNYNRLSVSGIKSLFYKPNKKMQIILGTNGSGKSSLLKELIPNTDNLKNDYSENGYKELKLENNGHKYTIIYDAKENKHWFKKDGVDLNPNGQIKIQKELIDKEFKITKDIHDLLLDKVKFTTMSPGERKKWFLEILSTVDYSYALEVFKRAKDRYKELQSFMKLTRSKLINEENEIKDLPDNFIDMLKSDIEKLNRFIESLIEQKRPYDAFSDLNSTIEKIKDLSINLEERIRKLEKVITDRQIELNKLNLTLNTLETKKTILLERKEKLIKDMEKVDELKLDESTDIEKMKKELEELTSYLSKVKEQLEIESDLDSLEFIFKTYYLYKDDINDYFISLQDSEIKDLDVSETNYINLKNKLENLQKTKLELEKQINNKKRKFDHLEELKNSKKTICPKCGYSWIEGYSNKEYNSLKTDLEKLTKEFDKIEKEIEVIKSNLDLIEKKRSILKSLYSILRQFNISNIKDKILNITALQNMINIFNIEIDNNVIDKVKHYRELKDKIAFLEKFDSEKLKNLVYRIEELKHQYSETIKELNEVNKNIEFYKRLKDYTEKTKDIHYSLEKNLKLFNKTRNNELVKLYNEYIANIVYEAKKLLSTLEDKYIKITNLEKRKKELEEELKTYELKSKAIKAIIDMLSPNKGLIGISVTNVVNKMIEKMNYIIKQIWTYDMEIIGYEMESNKFPVKIINSVIEDVSKGSAGMREVFDLAFKIVAMEYLDMLHYPLFLDEFGSNMDETHRIKAFDFIDRLTNEYFSQVFLISHFESLYSRFTNADVIILDKENINFNGEFNTVIKFNVEKGEDNE